MVSSLRYGVYVYTSYALLQLINPAVVYSYWLEDLLNTITNVETDNAGEAIRCYICNSRRDARCSDPFNATAANALDPVSCASIMSTRRFVTYFAKLLTTLGIPVSAEDDAYFGDRKYLNEQESAACQKVEIQDGQDNIIIRTCSILSSIVCEPPVDQLSRSLEYTFCDVCVTDYCNGCFINKPNFWILFILVIILYFTQSRNY